MSRSFAAPTSLDEALVLLAERPDARPVAGGTDLVVGARHGKTPLPDDLVAIDRIADLVGIAEADGGLRIGALTSHATLESAPAVRQRFAALADSSALVGSPATRGTGTLGGNLANASPAMETGSPLIVLGAEVELRSRAGGRRSSVEDFLVGPGRTSAAAGELIVAVHLPAPAERSGSAYVRLEYRRAMEIAVVGAAAALSLAADGTVAGARIALTAVAPRCLRTPQGEALLTGAEPTVERLAAAAAAAAAAASPISDTRASAAYRSAVVAVIARRALEVALRRARGEHVPVPANRAIGVNAGDRA